MQWFLNFLIASLYDSYKDIIDGYISLGESSDVEFTASLFGPKQALLGYKPADAFVALSWLYNHLWSGNLFDLMDWSKIL